MGRDTLMRSLTSTSISMSPVTPLIEAKSFCSSLFSSIISSQRACEATVVRTVLLSTVILSNARPRRGRVVSRLSIILSCAAVIFSAHIGSILVAIRTASSWASASNSAELLMPPSRTPIRDTFCVIGLSVANDLLPCGLPSLGVGREEALRPSAIGLSVRGTLVVGLGCGVGCVPSLFGASSATLSTLCSWCDGCGACGAACGVGATNSGSSKYTSKVSLSIAPFFFWPRPASFISPSSTSSR